LNLNNIAFTSLRTSLHTVLAHGNNLPLPFWQTNRQTDRQTLV